MFFFLILLYVSLNKIITEQVHPDEYKWIDSPYENDIESLTEDYNHIISSRAINDYYDEYKGIVYRGGMCCYFNTQYTSSSCYRRVTMTLNNYTNLSNINDTNHKELLHYGCYANKADELNIAFNYKKNSNDALISVKMRLTNFYDEPFEFQIGKCNSYFVNDENQILCSSKKVFDTYIIPNNSFTIYTFKFDENAYYLQNDNFREKHLEHFEFSGTIKIQLFFDKDKRLLLNSYIISVDLKRYVLSLSGHAHNYCSGCTSGGCYPRNSIYNFLLSRS